MEKIDFTEQEKKILGRSGDHRSVQRCRRSSVTVSILFIFSFFALGFAVKSWLLLAILASLYALVTMAQKLAGANTISIQKDIIVKLCRRINELNNRKG